MANAQNVAECSQQKRKRKVLSLESKLAILDSLSKGVSQARLHSTELESRPFPISKRVKGSTLLFWITRG